MSSFPLLWSPNSADDQLCAIERDQENKTDVDKSGILSTSFFFK